MVKKLISVDEALWKRVKAVAAGRGVTVQVAVGQALTGWVVASWADERPDAPKAQRHEGPVSGGLQPAEPREVRAVRVPDEGMGSAVAGAVPEALAGVSRTSVRRPSLTDVAMGMMTGTAWRSPEAVCLNCRAKWKDHQAGASGRRATSTNCGSFREA